MLLLIQNTQFQVCDFLLVTCKLPGVYEQTGPATFHTLHGESGEKESAHVYGDEGALGVHRIPLQKAKLTCRGCTIQNEVSTVSETVSNDDGLYSFVVDPGSSKISSVRYIRLFCMPF